MFYRIIPNYLLVKLAKEQPPLPQVSTQVEGQINCVAWSDPVITVHNRYRNIDHSGKLLEFFLNETSSNKYRNVTSEVWGREEGGREGDNGCF